MDKLHKEYKWLHILQKHQNKRYKPQTKISENQGYRILAAYYSTQIFYALYLCNLMVLTFTYSYFDCLILHGIHSLKSLG